MLPDLPYTYSNFVLKPIVFLILISWGLYTIIKSQIRLFSKECQGIPARIIGGLIILIAIALPTVIYNSVAYLSVALADWLNIIILLTTIIILKNKVAREETSRKWYSGAIIALAIIVAGLVGVILYTGVVSYVKHYQEDSALFCIFPIIIASIPGSLFMLLMMISRGRERGLSVAIGILGGVLSGAIAGSFPLLESVEYDFTSFSLIDIPILDFALCAITSGIVAFILSASWEGQQRQRKEDELFYTEKRIAQLEERLGKDGVVNNVPAEYVQKEREELAAYKETAEKLKTQLKR